MARIRSIKPEFWVDDQMVDLSSWARLLFIALWNFVDDDGLIEFKPKRIKMQVFPADDVDVTAELDSLISMGRLTVLDSDQGPVLWVTNWSRHQVVNRRTPTKFTGLPAPFSVSDAGVDSESSVLKGREGKGKEGKGREGTIPTNLQISNEQREWARTTVPSVNLDLEHDAFYTYWSAGAGRGKVKKSWDLTWKTWMRTAHKDNLARGWKPKPIDWMNR